VDREQLLAQFREAMIGIYDGALQLTPPYRPTKFHRMVNEQGAKETADILLAQGKTSDGFAELFTRGKESLKLSVEYLVLQRPWRELFEPEQLAVARQRLLDVECELPPEDAASPPKDIAAARGRRRVQAARCRKGRPLPESPTATALRARCGRPSLGIGWR
jgi:hypothetical protein